MALAIKVQIRGLPEMLKALDRISPKDNPRILSKALDESAKLSHDISTRKYFKRGGGGVGGRGVPPDPKILTSRSHRLRDSIDTDSGHLYAAIGTPVKYGPTHEFGDPSRNIRQRAFLKPAVEDALTSFPDIFLRHWRAAL